MKKQNIIQIIVAVLALLLMVGAISLILGDLDTAPGGSGGSGSETNDETTKVETVDRSEGDLSCAHVYDEGVVEKAATCKTEGVKVYTCTKCGKTFEDVIEVSSEHTYGALKKYDNNEHVSYCTVCDAALYSEHVTTDSIIPASCISNGVTVSSCACGYQVTVTSGKLEHSFSAVYEAAGDSIYHRAHCTSCGMIYSLSHTWGVETVVDPTCTSSGSKTKTCLDCGYVFNSTIPASGHDLVTKTVSATCAASGSKTKTCKNCDYENVETLPKLSSHTYGKPEFIGNMDYHVITCSVCSHEKTENHNVQYYDYGVPYCPDCKADLG